METRDSNLMTRRDLMKTAALTALLDGLESAAVPEYKMGIATTSFTAPNGAGGPGRGGPADTMAFLERCHGLGAAGIQSALGGDMAKLRSKAEEYGMWIQGMAQIPRNGDMAGLEHAFANARDTGATLVRCGMLSGRRYETFPTLDAWNAWVKQSEDALKLAVPLAEKYKVALAIENHKDWTTEQYVGIFKTYQSEYLGANYDFGNNLSFMEDPMAMAEVVAPYVKSAHIKDIGVQRYPDGFLMSEVPLGTGMLDVAKIMSTLQSGNSDLKFSLEMMTRDPLKVPCLTDHYWAVFPKGRPEELARTLRLVEARQSAKPLPVVDKLPREEREKLETENVKACLRYGKEHLNL
jgi:3-oxoisoapionate decarboxylase